MPTSTINYGFLKPLPFDLTDADQWGGQLNGDLDAIDALFKRALNTNVLSKGGNYTVTTADYESTIIANATTASFTITLPSAVGIPGFTITVKKVDATANTVTVQANGAELIDGVNTYVLTKQYQTVALVSDGANWQTVTKEYIPTAASDTVAGIIEIATDAESTTGTATNLAIVPSNFAQHVLSANGYQKFPGGYIDQWGVTASIPDAGSVVVTFPIAFPNNVFSLICTVNANQSGDINARGATAVKIDNTSFRVYYQDGVGTSSPVFWRANGN